MWLLSNKKMNGAQNLKKFLQERKPAILEAWFQILIKAYSAETRPFLQKKEETFTNPIGSTIFEALAGLITEIIQEKKQGRIKDSLEELIHLQAVQDFSPGQAISFLPALKQIIRKELNTANLIDAYQGEYDNLAILIDELTLQAFDIYMGCREKIFNLKVKELIKIRKA
ncbi:MAG: RsbRD N-terminal domain-containing protein [Thermodesulfobacteriota bacterium]